MYDERLNAPTSRWISVAFLQGKAADKALRMIARGGPEGAIAQLRTRDHGDETTDAALTNGYVYDNIPAGSTDRTIEDISGSYALTYSVQYRYVSLLRLYPAQSDPDLLAPQTTVTRQASAPRGTEDVWNAARLRSSTSVGHPVAL
jgi:hypothetical protein